MSQSKPKSPPDEWVNASTAAMILETTYQRARDLMMKGKFGEVHQEPRGQSSYFSYVRRAGVLQYKQDREAARKGKTR